MSTSSGNDAVAVKLAVLGSGGVGKSALTIRLVTDKFLDDYDPTIEDLYRMQVMVDGESAVLDILDTAGQEEFNSMQDQWMRDGDGFLLVYSITSKPTFAEVKSLYEKILRTKNADKAPVVLVGNKSDLQDQRVVGTHEGEELAKAWGCSFYETSARLKLNNEVCFFQLVRSIRELKKPLKPVVKKRRCTIL